VRPWYAAMTYFSHRSAPCVRNETFVELIAHQISQRSAPYAVPDEVGRCRLPVSKLELKACLVSALETEM
jgi:hypothetical protein